MSTSYILTITKQDEKHITEISRLAKKHKGEIMPFNTKDGKGFQFDFENDSDRLAFKEATDKLGLFNAETSS